MRRLLLLFALPLAAAAQTAAPDPSIPAYQPEGPVSGALEGVTGMDTVEAMMGAWNDAFRRFNPGATITVAQKDVAPEERIALGPRTAEVFHPDNQAYEDAYGYEPFRIKFCMGAFVLKSHVSAIGVFVNASNPVTQLSLGQLDAMFSDERRTGFPQALSAWGEVGLAGSWAEQAIHPYGFYWRDDVTAYFRHLVLLDAPFKPGYRVPGGDLSRRTPVVAKAIMAAVASDPGGIAFGNFYYQGPGVKAVALVDRHGVVHAPVAREMASGEYPLQRYLYFYVNRRPGDPLDPLTREFLRFVLSRDGQALVARDHYLPLTPETIAQERAKLD